MALIKCADNKYYESSQAPDYGNWYCTENQDGTLTLRGDSDTSKLPTNIPLGSVAITTSTMTYCLNKAGWTLMG